MKKRQYVKYPSLLKDYYYTSLSVLIRKVCHRTCCKHQRTTSITQMSVTIFNYHERTEMYFNVRIDEKLAGSVIDTMYTFFIAQLNLI